MVRYAATMARKPRGEQGRACNAEAPDALSFFQRYRSTRHDGAKATWRARKDLQRLRWMLSLSSGDIDLYICLLGSDNENNMKMNEDIEFMPYIAAFRFILSQTF